MGLGRSKARSQVTKVAPMPAKEMPSKPLSSTSVYGFQDPEREQSAHSFAFLTERNTISERRLPPLRETWYARYPAVTEPYPLDLKTEDGQPSIIKLHPPRRPQKLEPLILSKDVPLHKFSRHPMGPAAWRTQELEKRGPSVLSPTGRKRQHLHKMKMLEIRQEAERKRRLCQEAALAKSKMRDFKFGQMLGQHGPEDDSSDDEELVAVHRDRALRKRHQKAEEGIDPWAGQMLQEHGLPETHPGQISKVESWLLNQQARDESFWDAWSTDSDSWKGSDEGKLSRRPALVRTKTERIQLFDEFYDREF